MREDWVPDLRCPVSGRPYDLDVTRGGPGEIVEGFLVARGGRQVRPVLGGIPVLPRDLDAHLRAFGEVYGRAKVSDSRVGRFVLSRSGRGAHDAVPFDEVVRRYADLLPPGTLPEPAPLAEEDAALARLLAEHSLPGAQTGLDVGCGVGRGVFVLLGYLPRALGTDRSFARVRRARSLAVTESDFLLPVPTPGNRRREVALELDRLDRAGADFAVADPEALPFATGVADVVVLRDHDGFGPFDAPAALAEALRVLAPRGLLVLPPALAPADPALRPLGDPAPLRGWRRP